jgi:signal peptidase I
MTLPMTLSITSAAVAVLAASGWTWARWRFVVVTVHGVSMEPTYSPGQRVLVARPRKRLRRRDVVVIERPDPASSWSTAALPRRTRDARWLIKRIAAAAGDAIPDSVGIAGRVPPGYVVVLGDNERSYDSRQFGLCPVDRVLGVVVRSVG